MSKLLDQLKETVGYVNGQTGNFQPRFGIILGTGLGNVAHEIEVVKEIPYGEIPNFPVATVKGHPGKLILGEWAGQKVVAMAGRFHYYEGYTMQEVTFPVRVLKMLGIEALFVSNASGSINPDIQPGDLMIIRDHINLQPEHPLHGPNEEELGPRFPDMSDTYNKSLIDQGLAIAKKHGIKCQAGVYVGVQGPTLETPAEYTYYHRIGGDAVGMSTVPEIIVAKHMSLKVFAISVATDQGYPPEVIKVVTHEEVIEVAQKAEPKVTTIIRELIAQQ